MRRKIITMAAVLAILLLLSAAEQMLVRRITDGALEAVHAIMADIRADALGAAYEKAHALDRAWDEQANMLEMIVDHRSTDEVRYALSKLLAALESTDRAAAMIYAGELEGGVEHVLERQQLTMQNLL